MILEAKRKLADFGSGGFVLFFHEDGAIFGEDCDHHFFFKKNTAVMIAQGTDADKIMVEGGYDVHGGSEKVREEDVAVGGGSVGCAASCTDNVLVMYSLYQSGTAFLLPGPVPITNHLYIVLTYFLQTDGKITVSKVALIH